MKFNRKVLIKVIGDIMLDRWIEGKNGVFSAEAPIEIFKYKQTNATLGGVGNLSKNLKNLKLNFLLFTSISNDKYGKLIKEKLKINKIKFNLIGISKKTTLKTRYFINQSQIFRVDDEDKTIKKKNDEKILNKIKNNEIVIISDYKKGLVNREIHRKLILKNCLTFVDPKNKPEFYKNAYLVKPNLLKFEEWCGKFSKNKAFKLLKRMKWKWLIITCGHKGVYVFNSCGTYNHYKVKNIRKPNVIGAGDIFFSGLIYQILNGQDVFTASELSSYATTKLVSIVKNRIIKFSDFKKELVFSNGVFDILHEGHIQLLKFAKSIGKKLIVGINSDNSVRLNKGKARPYNKLDIRVKNLKKLNLIDEIIVFANKSPNQLIRKLKPDVIIKGDDYNFNQIAGRNFSNLILFKKRNNFSSSSIIRKSRSKF